MTLRATGRTRQAQRRTADGYPIGPSRTRPRLVTRPSHASPPQ